MQSFVVLLWLLGCVMVSSIFDQVLPRLALPLVQIAMGIVAGGLTFSDPTAIFGDPEFFLLVFIAPLLFNESRNVSKAALFANSRSILSLAIGLVIATALAVGFALNAIVPSVPLAAAFALGAALGPTDAAAVAALGKDVSLDKHQDSLLSGEALFNDASGVVSFEFAIAAAVTGTFSLADASISFAVEFFGGIGMGILIAAVAMFALSFVRSLGLESPTVYVLFEVCMPFAAFLSGENAGVSGILAVVAAGLFMKFYPRSMTLESSRYAVTSESVWELLTFAINGILFVLLGMKLPDVIMPMMQDESWIKVMQLVGLVLLVTLIVVGLRFVWVMLMQRREHRSKVKRAAASHRAEVEAAAIEGTDEVPARRKRIRDALVTTLSGPKGAVTLSIILTIPYTVASGDAFPERDLLVFLASGAIVCTLLLANFLVPALSPAVQADDREGELNEVKAQILSNVIDELEAADTSERAPYTRVAVGAYRERLEDIGHGVASNDSTRQMRRGLLEDQMRYVEEKMKSGQTDEAIGRRYLKYLGYMLAALGRTGGRAVAEVGKAGGKAARDVTRRHGGIRFVVAMAKVTMAKIGIGRMDSDSKKALIDLHRDVEDHARDYLTAEATGAGAAVGAAAGEGDEAGTAGGGAAAGKTDAASEAAEAEARPIPSASDTAMLDMTIAIRKIAGNSSLETMEKARNAIVDVEAEALSMELEQIRRMRAAGRLSAAEATEMREEVYLLQMGLESR